MRNPVYILLAGLVAVVSASVWANTPEASTVKPFAYYEVILERQPFGLRSATNDIPAADDMPSAEAAALLADLKLTGLVQGLDGTIRAGLVSVKTKRSYFLAPLEMADGLRLLAVRYDEQEADLEASDQKVTLKLATPIFSNSVARTSTSPDPGRGGSSGGRGEPPRDPRQMNSDERREWFRSMTERMRGGGNAPSQVNPSSGGSTGTRGPPPTPPAPPMPPSSERDRGREGESRGGEGRGRGRDMEHRLQEYQKELIKQGLPPLPIPLTPETDAQLVREGVLPPM